MKLSVNILTWNTLQTLCESIYLLKTELKGIKSEIIVVDNGSIDGTKEFMEQQTQLFIENLKIRYARNDRNLGISVGKNQGVDLSHGDYIFLLDADVVPVPNSVRLLIKHLDDNPGCQAIGFLPNKFSQKRNASPGQYHEEFCEKLDPIIQHRGHCIYYGIYRREVFQKIRFDEAYGVGYGYEDLDSYMQMEAKGIVQWAAGMNKLEGKYFHAINSSITTKGCLGFEEYMRSSMKRSLIFKSKWEGVHVVHGVA